MTKIELNASQAERLERLKQRTGEDASAVVDQALVAYETELDHDGPAPGFSEEDRQAIEEGLASLARGEGKPHDAVFAEIRSKLG